MVNDPFRQDLPTVSVVVIRQQCGLPTFRPRCGSPTCSLCSLVRDPSILERAAEELTMQYVTLFFSVMPHVIDSANSTLEDIYLYWHRGLQ